MERSTFTVDRRGLEKRRSKLSPARSSCHFHRAGGHAYAYRGSPQRGMPRGTCSSEAIGTRPDPPRLVKSGRPWRSTAPFG